VFDIGRRDFITLLGGAAAARPLAARAQQPERVRRVGVLMAFDESDARTKLWLAWFTQGLAELGWSKMDATCGWTFVGPATMSIECGCSRKNW